MVLLLICRGCIPLGAHVPQKVRDKIWANEFIDLGTLLPSQDPVEDPWSITMAPNTLTMKSNPFASKSKGPMKEVLSPVLYKIQNCRKIENVHHDRLKLYQSDDAPAWVNTILKKIQN